MTKPKASFTTGRGGTRRLAPNTREQKKAKVQKIVDSNLMNHGIDNPRLAIELAIDISKEIGIEFIIK